MSLLLMGSVEYMVCRGEKKHNSRGEATNCSSCDPYTQVVQMQIFQRQLQLVLETDGAHTVHISLSLAQAAVSNTQHNYIRHILYEV